MRKRLLLAFLLLLGAGSVLADWTPTITLGSWNVLHLGWNDNGKDYAAMAKVAAQFDLIALQEVMSPSGLDRLRRAVERETREDWETLASHAIGRGKYREHYAFLWRKSAVRYLDGAVVYIDARDVFEREPFSARFQEVRSGQTFTLATVHVVYGKTKAQREREAVALRDYWEWLREVYPDTALTLAGDFNLPPTDRAFAGLRSVARPLITRGKTTLSTRGGYANLYDNIWVSPDTNVDGVQAGIVDFPRLLAITYQDARKTLSDHAPVFLSPR